MDILPVSPDIVAPDLLSPLGKLDYGSEGGYHDIFSNFTLLALLATALKENVVKTKTSLDDIYDTYDYIIVGGGTAGCALASRLSQHPCVKVLLLEAGGEQPLLTLVPGFARLFLGSDIDWSYKTTPQKYSSNGQDENRVRWNSGKCLGGGSSLNSMLYVRGNKANFDQWAKEGCEGWSYDDVKKYFLKLEDNQNIEEEDPGYHHQGGPVGAAKSKYKPIIQKHLTEAMLGLGYPMNDVNGAKQFGIFDIQGTIRNQERCSTSTAYLKPACERKNLHIVTRAFVRKILLRTTRDGRKKAFAVVFQHKDKDENHIVRIGRSNDIEGNYGEIILSNGAVRTPQTLMLSGIGPRDQLEKFNIKVLVDLPGVGKNLMDHNAAPLLFEYTPLLRNALVKQISVDSVVEYALFRTGAQCSISQNTILGFCDGFNNTKPSRDFPMQEIYFFDYSTLDSFRSLNLNKEVEKKAYAPYILKPTVLCASQLLQPYSRGEVTLNSVDPTEFPNMNPNYLSDERDVKNTVEGLKICLAVFEQPAMKKLKAKWVDNQKTNYPGCEGLESNEYEYLVCLAKSVSLTIWHPSGTAKMGPSSDKMAVVDPELRVYGVDNLRVVSAAIMRIITSSNTNAPTIMIAEKAYDMIKKNIKCRSAVTIQGKKEVPDTGED